MNQQQMQKQVKLVRHWQRHPLDWVLAYFGDNIRERSGLKTYTGLTTQQEVAFVELGKLIAAKLDAHDGKKLTDEEAEYAKKIGLSIQSGRGCHAKGTQILMWDGSTKAVEDVVVGDRLMGDDSTPRRVLSLCCGREQMYRIRYHDGTYYDVNENHILSLKQTGTHGKYAHGQIYNATVKEYLSWSARKRSHALGYKVGVDFFSSQETLKVDPYILGVWLGDGAKHQTTIYSIDPEVVDAWRAEGERRGLNYRNYIVKEHHLSPDRGGRNTLKEDFEFYGVLNDKHIPTPYLRASKERRLELLAGLIDTDGTLDQRNRRVFTFVQKDKNLARQVLWLCQSAGVHATIKAVTKSYTWKGEKKSGTYYNVHIARNAHIIPTRIPRKQARVIGNGFNLSFGFKVEKLEVDDYYGFSLDGNQLFLLGDFTVTHNTGKDFWGALAMLFFMSVFDTPKCLATANTAKQLRSVYWAELSKIMRLSLPMNPKDPRSPTILEALFEWQSERIFLRERKGREWFCEAVTINVKASAEEQATALSGRHEDFMFFVVDEASGVPDPVFKPLEGTLTGRLNIVALIFNPTSNTGYAIESQRDRRFIPLRWNAEDSELVSKAHCQGIADKYGTDSNPYRISVLGLPPVADPDTLIPYDWIHAAIDREVEVADDDPVIFGVDPAAGGDNAVVLIRKGPKVLEIQRKNLADTMEFVGWVVLAAERWQPDAILVDNIGLGIGVYNRLRELGYPAFPVDVRRAPQNLVSGERFHKFRDELWWNLRTIFENGAISISNDSDLIDQLSVVKYKPDSSGKIRVDDKATMKARGANGKSPDEADALVISHAKPDRVFRKTARKQPKKADMKGVFLR